MQSDDYSFSVLAQYAVRYGLGRMTYATVEIQRIIRENGDRMTTRSLEGMLRDVSKAIRDDNVGDEKIDRPGWESFETFLTETLAERYDKAKTEKLSSMTREKFEEPEDRSFVVSAPTPAHGERLVVGTFPNGDPIFLGDPLYHERDPEGPRWWAVLSGAIQVEYQEIADGYIIRPTSSRGGFDGFHRTRYNARCSSNKKQAEEEGDV